MTTQSESLVWLIVGGAPRSGTTALGAALNQSSDIALFHEIDSHHFFSALDGFFREEDRLQELVGWEAIKHLIPTRDTCAEQLARALFWNVFGKATHFIGTKFPGYQAWPQPVFPSWISTRYIHITRNPFDVVLSMIKKDYRRDEVELCHVEEALFWWINAWNHAIAHAENENFLHVFYDDLLFGSEGEEKRFSEFLDGVSDFSLSSFQPTHQESIRVRYCKSEMEVYLPMIGSVAPEDGWQDFAVEAFNQRKRIGFPLRFGASIDLTSKSNGWQRYAHGFYAAESEGSWTKGFLSEILFSPVDSYSGALQISIEVVWSATIKGEVRSVEIRLDGRPIFSGGIGLGNQNGQVRVYSVYVPESHCVKFNAVNLQIHIKDPVNPAKAGLSEDVRDLGLMIRSIVVERIS